MVVKLGFLFVETRTGALDLRKGVIEEKSTPRLTPSSDGEKVTDEEKKFCHGSTEEMEGKKQLLMMIEINETDRTVMSRNETSLKNKGGE